VDLKEQIALGDDAVPAAVLEHVPARWRHLQQNFPGALVESGKRKSRSTPTKAGENNFTQGKYAHVAQNKKKSGVPEHYCTQ